MSNTERFTWNPLHGYALIALFGAALSAPLLLTSRAAGAPVGVIAASSVAPRAPEPRSLSVHGTAEVVTTPDEVTVVFRIDSFDRSLKAAKADNDTKARKALQLLASQGIPAASVQTGDFSITTRMEGPYERRTLTGYDVVKRITVSRCQVEQADRLLQELFEGTANVLESVSFAPSKIQEKRAEARLLAVKAAREKAERMAGELGQRLGPPLRVEETAEPGYFRAGNLQANAVLQNDSAPAESATLAAGKTRVQASVSVVFSLE